MSTPSTVVYRIDGTAIASMPDFYSEIGRAVNGPGGYFGSNLDALADCLRGGFGTPEHGDFAFEWTDSAQSLHRLGGGEPVLTVFDDVGVPLELR